MAIDVKNIISASLPIGYTGSVGYTGSQGYVGSIGGNIVNSETAPANPVNGQLWFDTSDGTISIWYEDGTSGQWIITSGPAGPLGYTGSKGDLGLIAETASIAPSNPVDGQMWFDTENGTLNVYYHDGVSGQWVVVSGPVGPLGYTGSQGAGYTGSKGDDGLITETASTAPSNPVDGQMWFDTENGTLNVYYYDGVSGQWVVVSGPSGPTGYTGSRGDLGELIIVSSTEPAAPQLGQQWYNTTDNLLYLYTSNGWKYVSVSETIVYPDTNGEASYTSPGTYSWTCPAGVNWVHVVCVGGGGGGNGTSGGGCGGGGGGLGWRNDISVIPGQSYTVVVGAGGTGVATTSRAGSGGNSYFIDTATVVGYGGQGGLYLSTATGGGSSPNGGVGGNSAHVATNISGGGGGAGGYSGNGGDGGSSTTGSGGTGGAGGGGGYGGSGGTAGAGGGVGILGQGTSGAGGSAGVRGGGGSGGVGGSVTPIGGTYGGGGAGNDAGTASGVGSGGAVRIIWGPNRSFPSTNTGAL